MHDNFLLNGANALRALPDGGGIRKATIVKDIEPILLLTV